jgi:hypothetical protein
LPADGRDDSTVFSEAGAADALSPAERPADGKADQQPSAAAVPTPAASHSAELPEAGRSLAVNALRGLHAAWRQARLEAKATHLADIGANTIPAAASDRAADAGPALRPDVPAQADSPADGLHADRLQPLIESCCDRLWVSDGRGGAPQGVLLDLGRWMPGCTIEVARAAGVLHLQLRGVDEARRRPLQQQLDTLGDALAHKLGCQVVGTVQARQEATP